ncbi:hypothetical protein [Novosphingobium sp. UBA1939]|uniref:hypothetical protein n=1 Tax=Novosphingobium sp. UBA1939 TaxID=1946982 RepID=UPI0025DC4055|nr:hypothetical protein [Novosphingobium sp. UBA1939]
MSDTPSQTGIVNGALADLGSTTRLQSIDDRGNTAAQARQHWSDVVRELLPAHTWNFAIRRTVLPLQEELPAGLGWKYAYALPVDNMRWLVPNREETDLWFEGEEEGGRILTNREAPLPLRYISAELGMTVSRWPAHFVKAVRTELAARMADAVTQSESITDRARKSADAALKLAKRTDGLQTGRTSRSALAVKSDWLSAAHWPSPRAGWR